MKTLSFVVAGLARPVPPKLAGALIIANTVAVPIYGFVYLVLLYNSGLVALGAADELCPGKPLASPALRQHLFPFANQCLFADSSVRDQVPGYANPVLFAATIALALLLLWTAYAVVRATVAVFRKLILRFVAGPMS